MNIGFQTSGLSGFTRVAYLWRRHASGCAVDCNGGAPSDRLQ
ncbi:hypothetical protein NXV57_06845 [Bacteroides thetaiotaomicron]|nr:hypothetical protein [Bacteroides thetaiotaomicron]